MAVAASLSVMVCRRSLAMLQSSVALMLGCD
jgi:hypothetical protein